MKKSFAEIDIENKGNYIKLLSAVSKLSGLFSESNIPFLNYRVAENIFCRSFNADNLSRSDTAFDANYKNIGVGLKTFISPTDTSREKIAEFNKLSAVLSGFKGKDLALELSKFRNERISLAKRVYNIESSMYHIVARKERELVLFETDYDYIDLKNIHAIKEKKTSLQFEDGKNLYSYNFSKSTLFRKFITPSNAFKFPIDIIQDPYTLLLDLFRDTQYEVSTNQFVKGINYVVLPLYGKNRVVYEKSGLNQWNAGGRKRSVDEIYIPIPIEVHKKYPDFFPKKDIVFDLQIPTKEIFRAKLCQENSKALMTNPNSALSDWLLRRVLKLEHEEILTIGKLDKLGIDSVIITKNNDKSYNIDVMKTNAYSNFISSEGI